MPSSHGTSRNRHRASSAGRRDVRMTARALERQRAVNDHASVGALDTAAGQMTRAARDVLACRAGKRLSSCLNTCSANDVAVWHARSPSCRRVGGRLADGVEELAGVDVVVAQRARGRPRRSPHPASEPTTSGSARRMVLARSGRPFFARSRRTDAGTRSRVVFAFGWQRLHATARCAPSRESGCLRASARRRSPAGSWRRRGTSRISRLRAARAGRRARCCGSRCSRTSGPELRFLAGEELAGSPCTRWLCARRATEKRVLVVKRPVLHVLLDDL